MAWQDSTSNLLERARNSVGREFTQPRQVSRRDAFVLVGFSIAFVCVAIPTNSAIHLIPVLIAILATIALGGSIALAAIMPRTAVVVHFVALSVLTLNASTAVVAPWPLPVTGMIGLTALLVVLAIRERWTFPVATWLASVIVLSGLIAVSPDRWPDVNGSGVDLMVYASSSLLVMATAIAIAQRTTIRADLAAARRDVELEQARREHAEERSRIARELHDVVAHSMSIVHMQSLSAPYRLPKLSAAATAEFESIALSARTALGEMRQLLGVLRAEDDVAESSPQPQVGDIGSLADTTSRAGTRVNLDIDPDTADLGPLVQLAVYRTVQEALSNVVRHAPGAPASVTVTVRDAAVLVSIVNTAPTELAPTALTGEGGHGLRGMLERITLLGGTMVHGPLDGGYHVSATLPAGVLTPAEPTAETSAAPPAATSAAPSAATSADQEEAQ